MKSKPAWLPLDKIITDRRLPDPGDVSDLVASIRKDGLREPIIVRQNGILIDGLRRMAALRQLDIDEVLAHISDDIYEVAEHLTRAHKGRTPSLRRVYEIRCVLAPLNRMKINAIRGAGQWNLDKRTMPYQSFQFVMMDALNLPYQSFIERVQRLYGMADGGDELALKLLPQVEAGTLTLSTAVSRLDAHTRNRGSIQNSTEQRIALESAIDTLSGLLIALRKLGPIRVPRKDLKPIAARLRTLRGELTVFTRRVLDEMDQVEESHAQGK